MWVPRQVEESPICSSHTLAPLLSIARMLSTIYLQLAANKGNLFQELSLESTDSRTRNSTLNIQSLIVGIHSK